jgi:phosphomannomutase
MVKDLVISTLTALGFNVIDLDYSTTPTVEMAVVFENAAGGIILTASHNPKEWNALKLLNNRVNLSIVRKEKSIGYRRKRRFCFCIS